MKRPEMWKLFNTKINKGESMRVFPISNWTEKDIWQYIKRENIDIVPLYFAKERPVIYRDGNIIMVDDDRLKLREGEEIQHKKVRFRTLGCYPLTGGVESEADTLDEIIEETLSAVSSERTSRVIDQEALYDSKLLYADQERALELDSKVGSREGKIDYSLLLDGLMAEREQGITIDVAYRYFTTDHRSFIVADTPGHEEYTRNMAVGASFADLAVILVDAKQGVLVQTKRHARICSLMGIKNFVFAVNKMDLVNYSEEVFKKIEQQIGELTEELFLGNVVIIPLSATEGDNVTKKSANIPWYQGQALLPYLEQGDVAEIQEEKGFYLPVQRVCRPNHQFRGFQGQIEAGSISVGDEITTLPSNEKAHVKSIHIGDKNVETAGKGRPVTIQLDREVDVSRGCVLSVDSNVKMASSITTTLLWMDDTPLENGKNYFVKLGTKLIPGVVTEVAEENGTGNGKVNVNTRAALKGQIPVVVEVPVGTDEVTLQLAEKIGEYIKKRTAYSVQVAQEKDYI